MNPLPNSTSSAHQCANINCFHVHKADLQNFDEVVSLGVVEDFKDATRFLVGRHVNKEGVNASALQVMESFKFLSSGSNNPVAPKPISLCRDLSDPNTALFFKPDAAFKRVKIEGKDQRVLMLNPIGLTGRTKVEFVKPALAGKDPHEWIVMRDDAHQMYKGSFLLKNVINNTFLKVIVEYVPKKPQAVQ